jgi:adenine phosphoribosyltransferase
MNIKNHIRHIPDFPKPGILFYDISTILSHPEAWRYASVSLANELRPYKADLFVGIESRGFITAAPVALLLNTGFIMARKKGKLPGATIQHEYALEYGHDVLEIQKDAIKPGQRVVVLDDLLASGGTMSATIALLRKVGAIVVCVGVIIELDFLKGRDRLDVPVISLARYDS